MTTKEFQRRCAFYADLNIAAYLFDTYSVSRIFKVFYSSTGQSVNMFCLNPNEFLNKLIGPDIIFDFLYFDSFTRSDFYIQLRYFKSFISRLSKFQSDKIHSDTRFISLFNYLFHEQNFTASEK